MPLYKKGIETRNKIYQSAKKMFYEYGYKKTTIEKIAEDADVPVGLVTYYFKKETILSHIYRDYMHSVVQAIEDQVGDRLNNHLQKHLLISQLFYICLVGDENNKEVYREIFIHRLISDDIYQRINHNMMQIVKDFHLEISEEMFHQMVIAEFGARRELLFHSYNEPNMIQKKDFFYFLSTIAARLAGVPPKVIEENIAAADSLVHLIDTSNIHFLI